MKRIVLLITAAFAAIGIAGCAQNAHPAAARTLIRSSGMGIDALGHTRMSEMRDDVPPAEMAHAQRLIAILRRELVRYQDPAAAERDGYLREGDDVAVGQLKHFFNYANFAKNQTHLDPAAPSAILYRRTLGHWHSHRNICVTRPGLPPLRTHAERARFGFEGSITSRGACLAAGGAFLDNVYGWMTHVYPYAPTLAEAF